MESASTGVVVWWAALVSASLVNVIAWAILARRVARERAGAPPEEARVRAWQLGLSAAFVAGCAFRSVTPFAEAQRFCALASPLGYASITRSVATVAELCFVAQAALWLRGHATAASSRPGVLISWLMVPAIAAAEIFSWYTALTSNFAGSVVEESLWTMTFLLAALAAFLLWRDRRGAARMLPGLAVAGALAYVSFMAMVDVPMYWSRWQTDTARGAHYLSVAEGWSDAATRRILTRRWEDWREEMPWMSLYFSFGVWVSLALVQAPMPGASSPAVEDAAG